MTSGMGKHPDLVRGQGRGGFRKFIFVLLIYTGSERILAHIMYSSKKRFFFGMTADIK
jgi:hypothetical protein